MAFAYSGAPALAAPTVHGYGFSSTPAVLPGVPTPVGVSAPFTTYGAPVTSAPFAQDYSSLFAAAPASYVGDSGLLNGGFLTGGAPIMSDFNGLYSGYQGVAAPFDAGFGSPSVYGGFAPTMTGAIAAPVAPARKVWQNGLRRSLVTGHPTRF